MRSTWLGAKSGLSWMETRPPVERSRWSVFSGVSSGVTAGDGASVAGSCATAAPANSNPATAVNNDFRNRSEEHTSELQSLMRISYAVFCLKNKKKHKEQKTKHE